MAATIDSKTVLLNERILFQGGSVVKIDGTMPVEIEVSSTTTGEISLTYINGRGFVLQVDGLSPGNHSKVGTGDGTISGYGNFSYIIEGHLLANLGGKDLYAVHITAFQI